MPRPIHAVVHSRALKHNLAVIRRHTGGAKVWAVVKANAYGHSIERVFDALQEADGFAALDLSEAVRLRDLGWRGPVLLLEGIFEAGDLELCSRLNLWHTVHCEEQIAMLAGQKAAAPHHVFLKLNSGMNRLGFKPQQFRSAWQRLRVLPQVGGISLMTHFSDADGEAGIAGQLEVFEQATQDIPGERSICNSAASLRFGSKAQVHCDWVRAGIALYGSAPDFPVGSVASWGLKPAMSLRSRIIAIQHIQPGETVGYGSTFTAETPLIIGIVACGYADGYPRQCNTGTPVLVDGVRTYTVGRVSMDMLAVNLTVVLQAGGKPDFGSEVVLWGYASGHTDGAGVLPIDEVAVCARTIGYQLMCGVAPRVILASGH